MKLPFKGSVSLTQQLYTLKGDYPLKIKFFSVVFSMAICRAKPSWATCLGSSVVRPWGIYSLSLTMPPLPCFPVLASLEDSQIEGKNTYLIIVKVTFDG